MDLFFSFRLLVGLLGALIIAAILIAADGFNLAYTPALLMAIALWLHSTITGIVDERRRK